LSFVWSDETRAFIPPLTRISEVEDETYAFGF
jgi:hypothetical protein